MEFHTNKFLIKLLASTTLILLQSNNCTDSHFSPCETVYKHSVETLDDYLGQDFSAGWQLPQEASLWYYNDTHEVLGGNGIFVFQSSAESAKNTAILGRFSDYFNLPDHYFNITIKYYSTVDAKLITLAEEYEFPSSDTDSDWSYLEVSTKTPTPLLLIEIMLPLEDGKYFLIDTLETEINDCSKELTTTEINTTPIQPTFTPTGNPVTEDQTSEASSTTDEPRSTTTSISFPCDLAYNYTIDSLKDYAEQEILAGWQLPEEASAWYYTDTHEVLGGNGIFVFESSAESGKNPAILGRFTDHSNLPDHIFNITIKYYSMVYAKIIMNFGEEYELPLSDSDWSYLEVSTRTPVPILLIDIMLPREDGKYFLIDTLDTAINHCPKETTTTEENTSPFQTTTFTPTEKPVTEESTSETSSTTEEPRSTTTGISFPCELVFNNTIDTLEDYDEQDVLAGWQLPEETSAWYYTDTHEVLGGTGVFVFESSTEETKRPAILGHFAEFTNLPDHFFKITIKYYSMVFAKITTNFGEEYEFPISSDGDWSYLEVTTEKPVPFLLIEIILPQEEGKYFLMDTLETEINHCPSGSGPATT